MHRFFLPPSESFQRPSIILRGRVLHHCVNTLRLQVGERIIIFNGLGEEAVATITHVKKDEVVLSTLTDHHITPRHPLDITLAQAITKAHSMKRIIQTATEFGATCITPLIAERTVVQIDAKRYKRQAKWQRIAIEACKQCGRNWLPLISQPMLFEDYFHQPMSVKEHLLLIASLQSDACRFKDALSHYCQQHGRPKHITIFVGPEGDFTPREITLAKSQGCQPVTLGPIILRADTAALYCLGILTYELYL